VSDETLDEQPVASADPEEPDAETVPSVGAEAERDDAVSAADAARDDSGGAGAGPVEDAPPAAAKDIGVLKEVLEALIFVHRGILPPKTVREVLGEEYTAEEIAAGFAALKEDYAGRGGALVLVEVAGGYQFGTRNDLAPWIKKLDFYEHHRHLSRPTMETLAIIAYKQPVTRAEIEAIRGVNVERIVRNLLERKLVRILGHKDVPGKPMVVGTTKDFLELFGLNSLADLPPLKDFVEPPSAEGIDEELPPAPSAGEAAAGGGDATEAAALPVETTEEETEHGPEPETGEREPDAAETQDDGEAQDDDDPVDGAPQAG
jgi:segregation and condensation protein B